MERRAIVSNPQWKAANLVDLLQPRVHAPVFSQGGHMPIYMVERQLPGITMDQLAGAQQAAISTSQQFTNKGKAVRYLRSTFVPGESHCMCLFEASTPSLVKEVNEAAKLPFTRIVEALDLTPP
jgi:hypothetical protein